MDVDDHGDDGSEYWPKTVEGRILGWLLAVYAFAVFGYITASFASFFVGRDTEEREAAVIPEVAAQPYPSNVIRLVVPSPAGTPPDIMGRIVANELNENEGWRVIVENKPGAIQTIGLAEVLRQPADGHTLAAIALSSFIGSY